MSLFDFSKPQNQNTNLNKGSIRAVEEYITHPNDFKNLKIGQAYKNIVT